VKALFASLYQDTNFVGQLTKLHQIDMVEEYIDAFEHLAVKIKFN
jgi:hypothetical protein